MSSTRKVLFILVTMLTLVLNLVVCIFALHAGPFMYAVLAGAFVAQFVAAYLKRGLKPPGDGGSSPYLAACSCQGVLPRARKRTRVPPQPRDVGTYTPERSPSPYEARIEGDEKHDAPPLELREQPLN